MGTADNTAKSGSRNLPNAAPDARQWVKQKRVPLSEWHKVGFELLRASVAWAVLAFSDGTQILVGMYFSSTWRQRLLWPPTLFASVHLLLALISDEQYNILPQHSSTVMVAYFSFFHVALPASLWGLHKMRKGIGEIVKTRFPATVLNDDLDVPAIAETAYWHSIEHLRRTTEKYSFVTFVALSAVCLWRLRGISPFSVLQGFAFLYAPAFVMAVRYATMKDRGPRTAEALLAAHVVSSIGIILAIQKALFQEYSRSQTGMVANAFTFSMLMLLLSPATKTIRWRVHVLQMAVFAAMESWAVCAHWEEHGSLAGIQSPAKPRMLLLGLVVLPSAAASLLLVALLSLVEAGRGHIHERILVKQKTNKAKQKL